MSRAKEPSHARFMRDVVRHEMKVVVDHELHRHLRFRRPGDYAYHFEIVTWPGYLCIAGDMGCYVFSRVPDMLRFFRSLQGTDQINPDYWEQKLQAEARERVKAYDGAVMRRWLEKEIEGWPERARAEAREDVLRHADNKIDVWRALDDFRFEDGETVYEFVDWYEADFDSYTYHYIWCCYAIVWAIAQYDKLPGG